MENIIKVYISWSIDKREVSLYPTPSAREIFITKEAFNNIIDSRSWDISGVQWEIEKILSSNIK